MPPPYKSNRKLNALDNAIASAECYKVAQVGTAASAGRVKPAIPTFEGSAFFLPVLRTPGQFRKGGRMTQSISSRPSLEHCRKEAKHLLKALRSGDPEALAEAVKTHQRFSKNKEKLQKDEAFKLSDAQYILARRYGFES